MTTEYTHKPSLSFGGATASTDEDFSTGDGSSSAVHRDHPDRQIELVPEAEGKVAAADDDDSREEFEFAFVVRDSDDFPSITADEMFSGGRILPAYPVFDRNLLLSPSAEEETEAAADAQDMTDQIPLRRLLIEEREAHSASSSEKTEAAGEYCAWAPDRCKKSSSTGSLLRWRLRDLMVGRSHSDGKEKFVFLEAAPPPAKEKVAKASINAAKEAAAAKGAKKPVRVAEMDMVTAHRLYYGKGAGEQAAKGPRRSFLPYRQELFGLFAPANGLRRSHHAF